MEESYHSFLMALKGKTVTIYKAGPESKKGRILHVNPEYIALLVENTEDTVIYYQVYHIKSVIEDTKTNSMQVLEELPEVDYYHSECFVSLLEHFVDQKIQINQGGPQSKHGILVAVYNDFLVLYTEDDGLVYFNIEHIKSVSRFVQNNQTNENTPSVQIPEWICVGNFQEVFQHLSHQWVSINRNGPDAMEGVLVENVGGHYTLVNNQEVMRIHPFHIQSMSVGPKGHLKQQNNNQQNNQEQKNESSNDSDESSSSEESSSSSNESSSSSNDKFSTGKKRTSGKKRSSNDHKEKIVKTINYRWKY